MATSLATLDRWQSAGLIDSSTAERIRDWEEAHSPQRIRRWPQFVALAFGAVLLAAGVLLFVSAHWEDMPPWNRFGLVVSMVLAFHVAAAFAADRFPAVSMALHAAGTLSLGGAIGLTGQIFNLSEHWPSAILLWAAGAVAGWFALRQWPQAAVAAILVPAWLAGEWAASSHYPPMWPVTGGLLALSFVYLSAMQSGGEDNAVRRSLVWIGGLSVLVLAILAGADRWRSATFDWTFAAAIGIALALCVALSVWLRGRDLLYNLAAMAWVAVLMLLRAADAEVPLYGWYAVGSAGLAWWGIVEARAERINLGIAGFALTVLVFYFSNVMDKLGRSASLIVLGLVFLGGGWALEQTRRRLISKMEAVEGGVL